MVLECLSGSTLPDDLAAIGYRVIPSEGERLLAGTIVERFSRTSSDGLELLTPASTKPVAEVHSHAGIVRVMRAIA